MEAWLQITIAAFGLITAFFAGGVGGKYLEYLLQRRKQEQGFRVDERAVAVQELQKSLAEQRAEKHALKNEMGVVSNQYHLALEENGELKSRIDYLEGQLGALASAGQVALITVDHRGVVVAWSPAATDMFGWTGHDALGQPLEELIIPDRLKQLHVEALARCFTEDRRPRSQPLIFIARNKWGDEMMIEVTLAGTKTSGVWHYTGTIRRRSDKFAD